MTDWIELFKNFWFLLQQGQLPELGRWNYVLLAVLVAVEGPIATLLGAAAASGGLMRIWAVFLSAAVGNLTADSLWYLLGYNGKVDTALRIGRYVGLRKVHLDRLTAAMQKHSLKILFFAKLTAGFMVPSLLAAGISKIPWKRWFPVLFLGEMIWTGTLVLVGYYTTESIKVVSREISYIVLAVSVLFLIVIIWQGRRILLKDKDFSEAVHSDDDKNKIEKD